MSQFFCSKPHARNGLVYVAIGEKDNKGGFLVPERESAFELNSKLNDIFADEFSEIMEGCFEFVNSKSQVVKLLQEHQILHDSACDDYLSEIEILDDL